MDSAKSKEEMIRDRSVILNRLEELLEYFIECRNNEKYLHAPPKILWRRKDASS